MHCCVLKYYYLPSLSYLDFSQSRVLSKCVHFHDFGTFRNLTLQLHCHCKNDNKHNVFQFEMIFFGCSRLIIYIRFAR